MKNYVWAFWEYYPDGAAYLYTYKTRQAARDGRDFEKHFDTTAEYGPIFKWRKTDAR